MARDSTRRVDGQVVPFAEAKAAWVRAGLPELARVAGSYGAYLTYQELAERLQARTGIVTGVPFRHWIGSVLGAIAHEQRERSDEPILTSLVVHADGTVGDGYVIPLVDRGLPVPEDLDTHAASERLKCYEYFGATLPLDGGRPMLTAQLVARRARSRERATVRQYSVCPVCFIRLPVNGKCDTCGVSDEVE